MTQCLPPRGQLFHFAPTNGPLLLLGEGQLTRRQYINRCGVPCVGPRVPQATVVFFPPKKVAPPYRPPMPPSPPAPTPTPTFGNTEQTCVNTCPDGLVGEPVQATVPADTFFRGSQEEANAAAMAEACELAAALRLASPCEEPEPPPPPDYLSNDFATLSGNLITTTYSLVVVQGTPAFVDGDDGAPVGPIVLAPAIQASAYVEVVVQGQDAFVDGADGAPVGPIVLAPAIQSSVYFLAIVDGEPAFVEGADGVASGELVLSASVQESVYFEVVIDGTPAFVDGADGVPVGPIVLSAALQASVYAAA